MNQAGVVAIGKIASNRLKLSVQGAWVKKLAILLSAMAIVGCATKVIKYGEAKSVPVPDRGPAYETYANEKQDAGAVIVVRDSGILGSAGDVDFFINGDYVAGIGTREAIKLYLEPGEHLLGVGPGGSFSLEQTKEDMEEQALRVEKAKTYYYRISVIPYKGLVLQRSSQVN